MKWRGLHPHLFRNVRESRSTPGTIFSQGSADYGVIVL
jgi:hypothetical protein